MTHDSTFRLNGTVRLLHEGVLSERPPHDRLADPFLADHAASSALWNGLPEAALTAPGTSTACPYLEQFFTAPVSRTRNDPETDSVPAPVYLCGSATSSMDVARVLAAHGQLPVWGSVLALSQRSGRGQLGRNWVSPEGNVYAALRLPQRHPFTGTAAAPAVGGLIAEALTHMGFAVHMKWPNDLLQREEQEEGPGWCKVGGILLEERPLPRHGETPAENLLVAGIGLNLVSSPPAALMRAQRAVPAGLLSSATKSNVSPLSVAGLWMRLVSRIFFCYVEEIDAKGKNAWRSLAERHLAFLGQTVLLTDGPDEQERHTGILEGLDDFGGLRLRNRKGTNSFLSGSLRLDRPPMQP